MSKISHLYLTHLNQKFDEVVREVQEEFVNVDHIDLTKDISQKKDTQIFTITPAIRKLIIPCTTWEVVEQDRYEPFDLDLTYFSRFRNPPKDESVIVRDPQAEKDTIIHGRVELFLEGNASPEDQLAYNLFEHYDDIAENEANENLVRGLAQQATKFLREGKNEEEFSKSFYYQPEFWVRRD